MDSKLLMIGDWVFVNNTPVQVKAIDEDGEYDPLYREIIDILER